MHGDNDLAGAADISSGRWRSIRRDLGVLR